MTPSASYIAGVRKRIRRVYRENTQRGPNKISPGEELRRWIGKKGRERKSIPDDINLWLMFLDEVIAFWFAVWAFYRERLDAESKPVSSLSLCQMTLAGRAFQDMVCLRDLITKGYFVQSNAVLRSCVETIDIMHLLNIEPRLADDFRNSEDNNAAAGFWHSHCSKKKIHKKIKARWVWFFDGDMAVAESFHDLRGNYIDLVGMSVHPSFPASFVTFMDTPKDGNVKNIFEIALGQVSHMSKFSIHLLLLRVFEYGFLWSGPQLGLYKGELPKIESSMTDNIKKGLSVLLSIVTAAGGEEPNHPFFPEFRSYWSAKSFI